MIIELLKNIKAAISGLTEVRMIDFDRGQLEAPEKYESLLQPALLVGIPEVDWRNIAHNHQDGDGTFYTKTVVRLPHNNAFYTTPEFSDFDDLTEDNLNELLIEDAIHQEVVKLNSVMRVRTQEYISGTFFVTEHTYSYAERYTLKPRYKPPTTAITPGINIILDKLNNP